MKNKYINAVKLYIQNHTPVEFIFDETKYHAIQARFKVENIRASAVIFASYALFYTALAYQQLAVTDEHHRAYDILIGDYINSYIAEILYKDKRYNILKIFANDAKEMMIHILNEESKDELLNHIIDNLKK